MSSDIFTGKDEWHRGGRIFCGNGTKDTVNAAGNDEVFTETDSFWRFLYDAGEDGEDNGEGHLTANLSGDVFPSLPQDRFLILFLHFSVQ